MCVCKSASDSVPGRTNQRLPTSCLSANRMPPRRERCDLYTELNSFNYTSLDNNIRDKLKTTLQEEAVTSYNNSKAVKSLKVLQFKVRINMKLPFARCIFLNIGNLPEIFFKKMNASDVFYVISNFRLRFSSSLSCLKRRLFKMAINVCYLSRRTVRYVVTWLASMGCRRRMERKTIR